MTEPELAPRRDPAVERQIALATLRLRRYRLARDRARAQRLEAAPRLARLIAMALQRQGPVAINA